MRQSFFRSEKMALCRYVKKRYSMWLAVLILAIGGQGTILLGGRVGIDTEILLALQEPFYDSWLSIGRFGLVLLKHLTRTTLFNPYMAGALTLLMLMAACILWTYLFATISGKDDGAAAFVFSALLVVSPILTEQFYFKLQSAEVAAGFALTAMALLWTFRAAFYEGDVRLKYAMAAGAVFIDVIVFGIYQVMVPLSIFGICACLFLYCFLNEEGNVRNLKKLAAYHAFAFAAGFAANQIITSIWFSDGNGYLNTQIYWFSQTYKDCLTNIYWHVKDVMTGRGLYYSRIYAVCCLLLSGTVLALFLKKRKSGMWFGLCCLLLVIAAPFYMTVLCATAPVMRSQLVLPFALAFMPYALFLLWTNRRVPIYLLAVLCGISCFGGMKAAMRLGYTDRVRYEGDVRLAYSIMDELDRLEDDAHSYPVVFVGKREAVLNNSCVRSETIGYSFFEMDTEVEPYGFFNTRRIVCFMHTLGGNYAIGNADQLVMAREYARDMACYPKEGSIAVNDGCIIVKLSD